MTDQTTPAGVSPDEAKKAREWALHALNKPGASTTAEKAVARVVIGTVPAPLRPTLADITPAERAACRWMQADVENRRVRYVITNPCDAEGDAALTSADGEIEWMSPERVTPRPDLPRLEWPGDTEPTPAPALPDGWRLADHKDNGRVMVTTPTPDRNGHVYYLLPAEYSRGFDWHLCTPAELTYIDQEADTAGTVPENTLTKGSEWDDVDALARACDESGRDQVVVADKDGDVFVWGADAGWWETGLPGCDYAPHTIIHAGKKAHQ